MTNITLAYPTLRVLLQDVGPDVFQYPDATLLQGLRAALTLQRIPGFGLTPDQNNITPDMIGTGTDPNKFALLIYHTCRLFIMGQPEGYSYKTRAMAEKFGSLKLFLQSLENDIHKLENGTMFLGWQSYHAWINGMMGLPAGLVLTDVNVK